MADTFLNRVDSVPLNDLQFTVAFESWLTNLVDAINQAIEQLEQEINLYNNGLIAPQFTTAEITSLASSAANGTIWYDTDSNQLKGKIGGSVVVIA